MKKYCLFVAILLVALCITIGACAEPNGWVKEGDYICYYSEGEKVTGIQTIGGKVYYFTSDGVIKGNGEVQFLGGSHYYIDSNNKINYGWNTVQGKKYYFDLESGRAYTGESYGPQNKIDDQYYLFDGAGVLVVNDWWTEWSYVGPFFHSNAEGIVDVGYKK